MVRIKDVVKKMNPSFGASSSLLNNKTVEEMSFNETTNPGFCSTAVIHRRRACPCENDKLISLICCGGASLLEHKLFAS